MTAYALNRRAFLVSGTSALVSFALQSGLGQSRDLTGLSLARASELLRRKAVSAVDLTQACLDRIASDNPSLNAFITVTAEQALTTAREMDTASDDKRNSAAHQSGKRKAAPGHVGQLLCIQSTEAK